MGTVREGLVFSVALLVGMELIIANLYNWVEPILINQPVYLDEVIPGYS